MVSSGGLELVSGLNCCELLCESCHSCLFCLVSLGFLNGSLCACLDELCGVGVGEVVSHVEEVNVLLNVLVDSILGDLCLKLCLESFVSCVREVVELERLADIACVYAVAVHELDVACGAVEVGCCSLVDGSHVSVDRLIVLSGKLDSVSLCIFAKNEHLLYLIEGAFCHRVKRLTENVSKGVIKSVLLIESNHLLCLRVDEVGHYGTAYAEVVGLCSGSCTKYDAGVYNYRKKDASYKEERYRDSCDSCDEFGVLRSSFNCGVYSFKSSVLSASVSFSHVINLSGASDLT